jgi:hypothetical protein
MTTSRGKWRAENHGAPLAHASVLSHCKVVKIHICISFLFSRMLVLLLMIINRS